MDLLLWTGVAAGGAAGAWARARVAAAVASRRASDFPFGTLAVNLTGSFVLGVLVGIDAAGDLLLIAGAGVLGGYTTFSTWMVETQRLGEDGEWGLLWLNLLGSMIAGLAVTGAGWGLAAGLA